MATPVAKILVVDDEPDIRSLLELSLEREGYAVETAEDGLVAIASMQRSCPDLVITDMRMPRADGLEVLHAAKAGNSETEVIILTGYASVENAVSALHDEGAFDYLTKPLVDLEDLYVTVAKALERGRLRRENRELLEELRRKNLALEERSANLLEARKELQAAFDRYHDLYEHAPMGYLTLSPAGKIQSVNRTGTEMLGHGENALEGKVFSELMHPGDRAQFLALFSEVQHAKRSHAKELRLRSGEGATRWFQMQCRSLEPSREEAAVRCAFFDISTRKEAERRLRQSESRWTSIMESSPSHVFLLDTDGRVRACNRRLPGLAGMEAKDENVLDYAAPKERELFSAKLETCCRERAVQELEVTHQPEAGGLRYYDVRIAAMVDRNGVHGLVASFIDVTRRRRAEQALEVSRRRYETLVTTIPGGIQEITTEGTITYANPAYHEMLKVEPGSLPGRSVYALLCSEGDRKSLGSYLGLLLEEKPPSTPWSGVMRAADGDRIDVQVTWEYQRAEDGTTTGFIAAITDVSDRRRWEVALKEERDRLETITRNMQAGLMVISPNYRVEWVNRVTGERYPDIVGKRCFGVLNHPEACRRHCPMREIVLNGKEEVRIECEDRDGHGGKRWIESICTPIHDERRQVRGMLVLQMDITAQKLAAEERRRLDRHLAASQKRMAIGTLAGGIAHRFNNALAAVLGYLEMMQEDEHWDADLDQYSLNIRQAAEDMKQQTEKLLAYAQGGKYASRRLCLGSLLRDSLETLRLGIGDQRQIILSVEDESLSVMADPTQFDLVLSALVQNAVEATKEEGEIRILVAEEEPGEKDRGDLPATRYACLRVADDGCGMEEETRLRIFEPYFSTKFEGRGMGMAAVQGIVANHGGVVAVKTMPGHGTEVRVYLPLVEVSDLGVALISA